MGQTVLFLPWCMNMLTCLWMHLKEKEVGKGKEFFQVNSKFDKYMEPTEEYGTGIVSDQGHSLSF